MDKLSEHFSCHEFACRCGCGFDAIDPNLLPVLEDLRAHFGQPVVVNCGCRCQAHNEAVNGAKASQHLLGKASDITVKNRTPAVVADYLEHKYPNTYGIGRYSSFTHIDVRSNKARWRG